MIFLDLKHPVDIALTALFAGPFIAFSPLQLCSPSTAWTTRLQASWWLDRRHWRRRRRRRCAPSVLRRRRHCRSPWPWWGTFSWTHRYGKHYFLLLQPAGVIFLSWEPGHRTQAFLFCFPACLVRLLCRLHPNGPQKITPISSLLSSFVWPSNYLLCRSGETSPNSSKQQSHRFGYFIFYLFEQNDTGFKS